MPLTARSIAPATDPSPSCPHAADAVPPPRRPVTVVAELPGFQHRATIDHGAMAQTRKSATWLMAVPVTHLPDPAAVRATIGVERLTAIADAFGRQRGLTAACRDLMTLLPTPVHQHRPDVGAMVQRGNIMDGDIHDAFFAVHRCADGAAVRHVVAILRSAAILRAALRDGHSLLDDAALARIGQGIMLCFALATGIVPAPLALPPRRAGPTTDVAAATRRWLYGHHIFLVVTHGLVLALDRVIAAADAGTPDDQADAIAVFAFLLDISADTLGFTGDFDAGVYDRVVRVAMAPPHMPEGFSGVFSSDHRYLVRRLREARPMFEAIGVSLPVAHAGVVASMTRLYDNHKSVCARFVGVDRTSLLMSPATDETAIGQLEKFKWSRLRNLGARPPA